MTVPLNAPSTPTKNVSDVPYGEQKGVQQNNLIGCSMDAFLQYAEEKRALVARLFSMDDM